MKRLLVLLAVALPAAFAFGQSVYDIRINEVLASGLTVQSPEGQGYDRVELYNPTGSEIVIGGTVLTDKSFLTKHVIAAGSVIPAGGFFVVNLDPSNTNGNHFNLSRGGDTAVYGIDVSGVVAPIHTITYGAQLVDVSIGSVPDGSDNWTLLSATSFGAANAAVTAFGNPALLRINEWIANFGNNDDFIELYNPDTLPINLSGLTIEDTTSGPYPLPSLSFIGTGDNAFAVFEADDTAGGSGLPFKLGGSDSITLRLSDSTVIDAISYSNLGNDDSQGRVPDGSTSIITFKNRPTPGAPNFGVITSIVINELLTHTDLPLEDAIEFYNPTDTAVNIGGWYLGGIEWWKEDPKGEAFFNKLKRYQFPPNIIVPARGYYALYEYQFKNNPLGTNFTFNSAHGGSVYLSQPDAQGTIIANVERTYKPAANGVSLGRITTSDGDVDFVPMARPSFGEKNGKPLRTGTGAPNTNGVAWGPVIINEIMYAPVDNLDGTTNLLDEYVELRNVTQSELPLFDPAAETNAWKLDGGIRFAFTNTDFIAANGYLLVVSFDPLVDVAQLNAFRARYNVPGHVPIRGPFAGHLGTDDTIELYRPDVPQSQDRPDAGFVPYLLTDRVHYEEAPWPTNSNRTGTSLQRVHGPSYGDEPMSWRDDEVTTGTSNAREIVITWQPQSQSVLVSNTALFTVTVSGGDPQYQWLYKGKPIKPFLPNGKGNPTATNATLAVQSTRKTAGLYSVIVTNVASRVVSETATLTAISPVVIKTQPKVPRVGPFVGAKRFILQTKAIGTAPLQYQWWKNGEPIDGATANKLILESLTEEMSGVYTVSVSNVLSGAVSSPATINIVPK